MNEALDVCVMCDHENGRTRYRGEVSRRDNDEVLFTGAWRDTPEAAKREAHEWMRAESAEVSALRASRDQLRKALARLCTQFPTDSDMANAGWETTAINEACNAYDAARAALAHAPE